MRISTILPAAILGATLTLTACATDARAVGTAVPTPPETAVSEASGMYAAPRMAALGDRIEARPGVFVTATATTKTVPEQGTGARIGHEPPVRIITVTVTYENRTTKPIAGMGTMDGVGGPSTLDGRTFAMSWSGESQAMAEVYPGKTGRIVSTVQAADGEPAYTGAPIQLTVPVPALLGEPPTNIFAPPAAYYTGTPTSE